MLSGFLSQLGAWFDRRFLVAYWAPTFIILALLGLGGAAARLGPSQALAAWVAMDAVMQIIIGFAALAAITVLAYVLQAFTTPIIRLYEGYWRDGWLRRWAEADQRAAWQALQASDLKTDAARGAGDLHRAGAYRTAYFNFPRNPARIRGTRLGNTLVAAEEYSGQVYRLDSVLWWPRLTPLLPETFRNQIDAALTPMLALINLSFLLGLLALLGGLALLVSDLIFTSQPIWLYLLVLGGGLLLARLSYLGAVAQAADYGNLIRVAFDLYRHAILKEMHIPIPTNLADEGELWAALNQWVYGYVPPPEANLEPEGHIYVSTEHFRYDNYTPPSEPQPSLHQVTLELRGSPTFTVQQQGGEHG